MIPLTDSRAQMRFDAQSRGSKVVPPAAPPPPSNPARLPTLIFRNNQSETQIIRTIRKLQKTKDGTKNQSETFQNSQFPLFPFPFSPLHFTLPMSSTSHSPLVTSHCISNRNSAGIKIPRNSQEKKDILISNRNTSDLSPRARGGFPARCTLPPTPGLSNPALPAKIHRARALRACDDGFVFNANLFREIEPDGCE
jgi:hypothetical protein